MEMSKGQEKIKIAILGYGNLGKGAELAVLSAKDMQLTNIFTRRAPEEVKAVRKETRVLSAELLDKPGSGFEVPDVLLVCAGSATDLPILSPKYAEKYNIVDSFDNHAEMQAHFDRVNRSALNGRRLALIAAGWDPGLFSMLRAMYEAMLPNGRSLTFWGEGISQGHSDAIRRLEGVVDARQYTVPKRELLEEIRRSAFARENDGSLRTDEGTVLMAEELERSESRHERKCFVSVEEDADRERIRNEIIHMPSYFEGYRTEVNFVTQQELYTNHGRLPHGGTVIRTGSSACELPDASCAGGKNKVLMDFSLKLDSNPEFTAGIMTAYARAVYRMARSGAVGCRSVFQIPLQELFCGAHDDMIKWFL